MTTYRKNSSRKWKQLRESKLYCRDPWNRLLNKSGNSSLHCNLCSIRDTQANYQSFCWKYFTKHLKSNITVNITRAKFPKPRNPSKQNIDSVSQCMDKRWTCVFVVYLTISIVILSIKLNKIHRQIQIWVFCKLCPQVLHSHCFYL